MALFLFLFLFHMVLLNLVISVNVFCHCSVIISSALSPSSSRPPYRTPFSIRCPSPSSCPVGPPPYSCLLALPSLLFLWCCRESVAYFQCHFRTHTIEKTIVSGHADGNEDERYIYRIIKKNKHTVP